MGAIFGLWTVVTVPLGPCPGPEAELGLPPDASELAELDRPLPCLPREGLSSETSLRGVIEAALGPLAPPTQTYHLETEHGTLRLDRYATSRDLGYVLTCGGRAPGLETGRVWGRKELGQDLGPAWSPRVLIIAADDPSWQGLEGLNELQRGVLARIEHLERIPTPPLAAALRSGF